MSGIDFKHKIYNLIPSFLRKQKHLNYLYALIKPLKEVNNFFEAFKSNKEYQIKFTSETNLLEHFLNDQFDTTLRRIYITTINEDEIKYIFTTAENKSPVYIFTKSLSEPPTVEPEFYVFTKNEILTAINFIINVPASLVFDELYFRAKVDNYNQVGKNYTIKTF